jgi:hypothetical protein
LPGTLGGLIGRLFYYFERILDTKNRVSARNLIPSLDNILDDLYEPGQIAAEPTPVRRTTAPVGLAAMVAVVAVNWGLLLI